MLFTFLDLLLSCHQTQHYPLFVRCSSGPRPSRFRSCVPSTGTSQVWKPRIHPESDSWTNKFSSPERSNGLECGKLASLSKACFFHDSEFSLVVRCYPLRTGKLSRWRTRSRLVHLAPTIATFCVKKAEQSGCNADAPPDACFSYLSSLDPPEEYTKGVCRER